MIRRKHRDIKSCLALINSSSLTATQNDAFLSILKKKKPESADRRVTDLLKRMILTITYPFASGQDCSQFLSYFGVLTETVLLPESLLFSPVGAAPPSLCFLAFM